MYTDISDKFSMVHSRAGRTFAARIEFGSEADFLPNKNSEILSLKQCRGNSELEDITIGDVSSAMFTAEFTYHEATLSKLTNGTVIQLYLGLDFELDGSADEAVPMGEFKVDSAKRNGNKITATFVDKLYNSDTLYKSFLAYPATAVDVLQEICNSLGIGYELSFAQRLLLAQMTFDAAPANITKRQMISYIASFIGKNAYLNRDGILEFGWYNFGSTVSVTDDEIETPTIGEKVEITALVCGVDSENILKSGEGRAITFENPYMTQERLDELVPLVSCSYVPCELKQLVGSILLDFDVLAYGDNLIPIMSSELEFDGGVSLNIKSVGKTEEEAASQPISATDLILKKSQNYADSLVKSATELLSGAKGGYYIEKTDETTGKPYETLWMDAEDEDKATHCVVINQHGIGFGLKDKNNKWEYVYAWTIDGTFNTEYINGKRLVIEGEISDAQDGTADGKTVGLHYQISSKLALPTFNNKNFNASGLKAWDEDKDGENSKTFFTNWGMFMDNSKEDAVLTSLIAAIAAAGGKMNYFGNGGFAIQNSKGDYINGSPEGGFSTTGSVDAKKVTADEVLSKDEPCLTGATGAINGMINGYLKDCNSPSIDKGNRICVDSFNGETANSPFPGSVGYVVTFRDDSDRHIVQFCIRYRDNEIKMRVYNRNNSNSDGTNPAWSDWSENFVTKDVTDDLLTTVITLIENIQYQLGKFTSEFDSATGKGYEESLSGVIKNWGTATIGPSGTTITFDWTHKNKNYAVCITPFGKACDVWYNSATITGMKLYASADNTTVSWMTVGL